MSKNRTAEQAPGLDGYADMFKALSNPHRLKIFMRLSSCCVPGTVFEAEAAATACVGDLGQNLGLSPSTVSHHIKELHRAGLIRMERRGQKTDCWVDPEVLSTLSQFFGAMPAA